MNDIQFKKLPFDDGDNLLVVKMNLDKNNEPIYDIATFNEYIQYISEKVPDNVTVLGLLPGAELDLWSREDLLKYINFLETILKDKKD